MELDMIMLNVIKHTYFPPYAESRFIFKKQSKNGDTQEDAKAKGMNGVRESEQSTMTQVHKNLKKRSTFQKEWA